MYIQRRIRYPPYRLHNPIAFIDRVLRIEGIFDSRTPVGMRGGGSGMSSDDDVKREWQVEELGIAGGRVTRVNGLAGHHKTARRPAVCRQLNPAPHNNANVIRRAIGLNVPL